MRYILRLLVMFLAFSAFLPASLLAASPEPERSAVVQEFLDYLLKPGADISEDAAARQKWLSADLQARFDAATHAVVEARKRPGVDGPEPAVPGNGTFLYPPPAVWGPRGSRSLFGGVLLRRRSHFWWEFEISPVRAPPRHL